LAGRLHRHEILADLYTILLGNPELRRNADLPTRFKEWMRLIGSAFEHAAKLYRDDAIRRGVEGADKMPVVSFKDLFLTQDEEDEQSVDLGAALNKPGKPGNDVGANHHDRSSMNCAIRNGGKTQTSC
jgi:hypothetical protein